MPSSLLQKEHLNYKYGELCYPENRQFSSVHKPISYPVHYICIITLPTEDFLLSFKGICSMELYKLLLNGNENWSGIYTKSPGTESPPEMVKLRDFPLTHFALK